MSEHMMPDMASSSTGLLFNFRDLGGLSTRDNDAVAANRLFRSGHHAGLSVGESRRLLAYDFDLIVDLRYPDERAKDLSPWPADWTARVLSHGQESGKAAPHIALLAAATKGVQAIHGAYRDLYAGMPFDPTYRALFVEAIERMARIESGMLIHCSAGKDRTGVLVALLLDLLGVPRDVIAADYLLSAVAPALLRVRDDLAVSLGREGNPRGGAVAAALTGVETDYLDAMFAAIERAYGSVEGYLLASGVEATSIAKVRARLVGR